MTKELKQTIKNLLLTIGYFAFIAAVIGGLGAAIFFVGRLVLRILIKYAA